MRSVCVTPGCNTLARDQLVCTRCWWDLTGEERAAIRMAWESPFNRELRVVEYNLAVTSAADALVDRRAKSARAAQ